MAQFFQIHPETPQPRLVKRAVEFIQAGGVVVYPSDGAYALGCSLDSKTAVERIRTIRRLDDKHLMSVLFRDLAQVSNFARLEDSAFRLIKTLAPGPFTFVLKATREMPRRLQHPTRKTIGVRLPGNPIAAALVQELGEPMFTATLILPGETEAESDPYEIRQRLEHEVDAIIDGGHIPYEPTTIVSFTEGPPEVLRQGKGQLPWMD